MQSCSRWLPGFRMFTALVVVSHIISSASAGLFDDWAYKMPITFPTYAPSSSLANFPVLVAFDEENMGSGFSYDTFASPDAADLRFATSDGMTELPYEIEQWNTNGTSFVWVRIPELSAATEIAAYWGNPNASPAAYTSDGTVWSEGFRAVWHFGDNNSTLDVADSSANQYHAVNSSATAGIGKAGGGVALSGYWQYLSIGPSSRYIPANNAPTTVSLWLLPTEIQDKQYEHRAFSIAKNGSASALIIGADASQSNSRKFFYFRGNASGISTPMYTSGEAALNTWTHVASVFDGQAHRIYVNGELAGGPITDSLVSGSADIARIGAAATADGKWFKGRMDEVRVSSSARSPEWIWAEYATMNSPADFAQCGAVVENHADDLPTLIDTQISELTVKSVMLNGQIVSGETPIGVFAYWGVSDGATDAAVWGNSAEIGEVAPQNTFSVQLSGLASNTVYYYRFNATNAWGNVWSTRSSSFKTPGPPAISFESEEAIADYRTARFQATLFDGTAAAVDFLLGETAGVWTITNSLGTVSEGQLFTTFSDLQRGTTYYACCVASNAHGFAASEVYQFTTKSGGPFYVTPTGSGDMTGSDWDNAFDSLQTAVEIATESEDIIYLMSGVYSNAAEIVINDAQGLTILGGYAGIGAPGATGESGTVLTTQNPGVSVQRILSAYNSTVLFRDLEFTGGMLNNIWNKKGGGLYFSNCPEIVLESCKLVKNSLFHYSNVHNESFGAGLYSINSNIKLDGCLVEGNAITKTQQRTDGKGVGIYINGGSSEILNSRIAGNLGNYPGGPYSYIQGAGIWFSGTSLLVYNCRISGNDCRIALSDQYSDNCRGDGIFVNSGTVTIEQCTIVGNGGEGVCRNGGTVTIENSILWSNGDDVRGTIMLSGCNVENGDGDAEDGNFSEDPHFERGLRPAPDGSSAHIGASYPELQPNLADLYVSAETGSDVTGDGSEIAPLATLTKALEAAVQGTRIHAAPGIYTTPAEKFPLEIREDGIQIIGEEADETIIDAANSGRVVDINGARGDVLLSGLTFRRGLLDSFKTKITIHGAGIYASSAGFSLEACIISNNALKATGTGWNACYQYGGGASFGYCDVKMNDCVFVKNNIGTNADGDNLSGHGLYTSGGTLEIAGCRFLKNGYVQTKGSGNGGGLFLSGSKAIIRNNVFASNIAKGGGAGLYISGISNAVLAHLTVSKNTPDGLRCSNSHSVENSIFWNNGTDVSAAAGTLAVYWSDVGTAGSNVMLENCLSVDPLFVDPPEDDYHLKSRIGSWRTETGTFVADAETSPCIDAGMPTDRRWIFEPEPNGHRINMGAYGGTGEASKSHPDTSIIVLR
jgi:hypothetical protein